MTVQRDVNEIRSAMKPIRMRAGVPDFDDVVYENQELFRTALKRERQIELVGENCFRYYDLRRWKDALLEENQPLMGCNINISETRHASRSSIVLRLWHPCLRYSPSACICGRSLTRS